MAHRAREQMSARRAVVAAVVAAVIVVVALPGVAGASGRHIPREGEPGTEGAVFRVLTRSRVVALTFDDGPDPRWTPHVLELLRAAGAHATFFDTAEHVLAHPELVGAELHAGHETADHTVNHPDLRRLGPSQVQFQVDGGADALLTVGAPAPRWFRPPKGLTDETVLRAAHRRGLEMAFWDMCVEHYINHTTVDAGVDRMLTDVRPGDVILAHDGGIPDRSRTMAALPRLLDGLRRRGYRVVSLAELVRLGRPTDS